VDVINGWPLIGDCAFVFVLSDDAVTGSGAPTRRGTDTLGIFYCNLHPWQTMILRMKIRLAKVPQSIVILCGGC